MQFLDLIETIRAEEASRERLYSGEGQSIRGLRGKDPRYQQAFKEALDLVAGYAAGRVPGYRLREAMTTADFPLLFGDIIDRQLLANYQETKPVWPLFVHRSTVPDFRTVKRFAIDGSQGILPAVQQQTEYPEGKLSDTAYQYAVTKYGRKDAFSWEAMINDDLQALQDIPDRYGRAARRSEEKFATELFASSTGPNATFFSDANKNLVDIASGATSNNPVLSIQGLQDAYTVLHRQVDVDGDPIAIEAVVLVVPPSLEVVAQNILHATAIWYNDNSGTTSERVIAQNWMNGKVTIAVDYYLPIVDTTHGGTAWYLFADPNSTRPALEMGFLRGHETPEIFMKDPNAVRVGGGTVSPMDGDFDTDSIQYKVRHIFGGVLMEPKAAVASNGSGA